MIIAVPDEPIWEYEREDNVIVIPITKFVRKDGGVVFVEELAKSAGERYPTLANRWGWLLNNGVSNPVFRQANTNLLGLPDRKHYASKPDAELVEGSLWYLSEQAMENPKFVYYLVGPLGGEEFMDAHKEILDEATNVVLLRKDTND